MCDSDEGGRASPRDRRSLPSRGEERGRRRTRAHQRDHRLEEEPQARGPGPSGGAIGCPTIAPGGCSGRAATHARALPFRTPSPVCVGGCSGLPPAAITGGVTGRASEEGLTKLGGLTTYPEDDGNGEIKSWEDYKCEGMNENEEKNRNK